jgi:E3 ubiquitin-protein ligase TRIP12
VCTVFARLVENFQRDRLILKEIASHSVLTNMQHLLVAQPPVDSPSIFITILHTIYLMCANCNELAIDLLENKIANTFRKLLVGSKSTSTTITTTDNQIEILTSRSPQELYELVSIIGEIMPRLPQTGIFSIHETLRKTSLANHNEHIMWQWKDIIESAFSQEDECILNTMGRTYVLDFNSMLQINEDTGTTRPIARKVLTATTTTTSTNNTPITTSSSTILSSNTTTTTTTATNNNVNSLVFLEKNQVYAEFVSSLFSILYEVYNSSAGSVIKHRSLRAILSMNYYSNSNNNNNNDDENVLHNLLKTLPISSHIASMLVLIQK